jgi:hypothetical protein
MELQQILVIRCIVRMSKSSTCRMMSKALVSGFGEGDKAQVTQRKEYSCITVGLMWQNIRGCQPALFF